MALFRSAALRRIIYVIAFGLALTRFLSHAHSEPRFADAPASVPAIVQPLR